MTAPAGHGDCASNLDLDFDGHPMPGEKCFECCDPVTCIDRCAGCERFVCQDCADYHYETSVHKRATANK